MNKVNIAEKFSAINTHYDPHVVASLNEQSQKEH